jgi:hypothetical protein
MDTLGRDNAKPGVLQHLGDGAGKIAAGGIGLDNRKGARRGHDRAVSCDWMKMDWCAA